MSERQAAFRRARRCYGHLAGEAGVRLRQSLELAGFLHMEGHVYRLTAAGRGWVQAIGLDCDDDDPVRYARCCLDGTEKQLHVGGRLGRSMLEYLLTRGGVSAGEGRTLAIPDFRTLLVALELPALP